MRRILSLGAMGAVMVGAVAVAATADRLARLNVAETELSVDQGLNMHRLSRLLSVLEQLRRDPPPALLVSPQDAKDAVRAAILVKAMTPDLQARARGYADSATEVMRQRRLAAVQSEALFERDSLAADALPEPDAGVRIGAAAGAPDVYDSGVVASSYSVAVAYAGAPRPAPVQRRQPRTPARTAGRRRRPQRPQPGAVHAGRVRGDATHPPPQLHIRRSPRPDW